MRRSLLLFLAFCLSCEVLCLASSQHNSHDHLPMPMTAPLYLENDLYSSTLYLVNALSLELPVDIAIYDMSGTLLTTRHSYMPASSQLTLAISRMLSDAGIYSEIGSVEVVSPSHSSGLLGQLSITRKGDPISYLDEELFMPPPRSGSNILRAVLDGPSSNAVVAVTNTSLVNTHSIQTTCLPLISPAEKTTYTLQPKQTLLVRGCVPNAPSITSPSIMDAELSTPEAPTSSLLHDATGIEILSDGSPGEITSFAFSFSKKKVFGSGIFLDPQLLRSSSLVFVGFPVGKSDLLSSVYEPRLAVTNFSPNTRTVNVDFSSTTGGIVSRETLLTMNVSAWSSVNAVLRKPTKSDGAWQNAIVVRSNGSFGDILSKLSLVGGHEQPSIEMMPKDEKNPYTAGHHPWSIRNGTNSTLFLFNHSEEARAVDVEIGSSSGLWVQSYTLKAGETLSLSVNDIVNRGVKDSRGNKIGSGIQDGELSWWAPAASSPEVTGRVVQINAERTEARNFSCQNFTLVCDAELNTDSLYLVPDETDTLTAQVTLCQSDDREVCDDNGNYGGVMSQISYSWNSDTPSVATVANRSALTVSWNGVGAGSANATFTATNQRDMSNSCEANAKVIVRQPASLPIVRTTALDQNPNCPSGSAGPRRVSVRQLADQNGQPIPVYNQNINEQLTVGSPNDLNFQSNTITPQGGGTDSEGQIIDTFSFCSQACPSFQGITNIYQTLTDTSSGGPWGLGQYTLTFSCPNVKVNGSLTP